MIFNSIDYLTSLLLKSVEYMKMIFHASVNKRTKKLYELLTDS
jgi:hypothetical protein